MKNQTATMPRRAAAPSRRGAPLAKRLTHFGIALLTASAIVWVAYAPHGGGETTKGPEATSRAAAPTPRALAPGVHQPPSPGVAPQARAKHAPTVSEREIPASVAAPPTAGPEIHLPAPPVQPPNPQTTKLDDKAPDGVN